MGAIGCHWGAIGMREHGGLWGDFGGIRGHWGPYGMKRGGGREGGCGGQRPLGSPWGSEAIGVPMGLLAVWGPWGDPDAVGWGGGGPMGGSVPIPVVTPWGWQRRPHPRV